MAAIKFHLENEEWSAVARLADDLQVGVSDIAYVALHRLMLEAHDPEIKAVIRQTPEWRGDVLPVWSSPPRQSPAFVSLVEDAPEPVHHLVADPID
jgi:hypothetical protein